MSVCIFDRIVAGEIPAKIVYRDETVLAFRDINPQAPVHLLIIPRKHYPGLNEMTEAHEALLGHMVLTASKLAAQEGIAKRGYRVAINCGAEGGQVVPHLHLHLLGGRRLSGELG